MSVPFEIIKNSSESAASPQFNDLIEISYEGLIEESGQKFESTITRGQPRKLIFGVEKLLPSLQQHISKMRVGQFVRITLKPDEAYGELGIPGRIPPNATLVYNVELLSINKPYESLPPINPSTPIKPITPNMKQLHTASQPVLSENKFP